MQATRNGNDLWLSYWVAHVDKDYRLDPTQPVKPSSLQPPGGSWRPLQVFAALVHLPDAPARQPPHLFLPPREVQGHGDSRPSAVTRHRWPHWKLGWLPLETSFYFSVLLLIAAANSLFTMVRCACLRTAEQAGGGMHDPALTPRSASQTSASHRHPFNDQLAA